MENVNQEQKEEVKTDVENSTPAPEVTSEAKGDDKPESNPLEDIIEMIGNSKEIMFLRSLKQATDYLLSALEEKKDTIGNQGIAIGVGEFKVEDKVYQLQISLVSDERAHIPAGAIALHSADMITREEIKDEEVKDGK